MIELKRMLLRLHGFRKRSCRAAYVRHISQLFGLLRDSKSSSALINTIPDIVTAVNSRS